MDGWREISKDLYQGEAKKGRHPPDSLRHVGSGLHAETGCRKVYASKLFEWQTNSMKAEEMFGDSGGRNYSKSHFFNQNRQDVISMVSAVQNSDRGPRWEHWQSNGWNTLSHQQCRLRKNAYDSYGCRGPQFHLEAPAWQRRCYAKLWSQKASSILSRLTKKVTWACCGDEKSF